MTGDDDIRAVLPEPPPPAPKPRDAAIAAALARFDGAPGPARARQPEPMPWWQVRRGPQAAFIAATALVVMISLPFAWRPPVTPVPTVSDGTVPGTNNAAPPSGEGTAETPTTDPALTQPSAEAGAVAVDPPPPQSGVAAPISPPIETAQASPPAPLVIREKDAASIAVQGQAVSQPLQRAPISVSVVSSDEISRVEGSIVVTGSRTSPSKPLGRGDWNSCTVNDPSRALSRCRRLADKAPKAVRGQAETHLSDGLTQAWIGNLNKAIAEFDAAIAIAPKLEAAYLNRGLIYDQKGESETAIADLDRAVRLSPKSARAHYNRSVLLRKYGDPKRADADAQLAISLDPRYHEVLR